MQSVQNNRERAQKELERLDRRLRPFVINRMRGMYGVSWEQEAQKSLHHPRWTRGKLHLDWAALFYILRDQWESLFQQRLGPAERKMINHLLRMRNQLSHQEAITNPEVEQLQKHIEHLLTWIDLKASSSGRTFTQTTTKHSTRPVPAPLTPGSPTFFRTSQQQQPRMVIEPLAKASPPRAGSQSGQACLGVLITVVVCFFVFIVIALVLVGLLAHPQY